MRRRGDMFMLALDIIFLVAILLVFWKLSGAFAQPNPYEGIGTRQTALLHTYAMSEQMLLYLDEAGKYAAYDSLATVMGKGGILSTSRCGTYATYSIWTSEKGECFPSIDQTNKTSIYTAFERDLQKNLWKYMKYPGFPSGVTYTFTLVKGNGLTVIAIPDQQISLPIVTAKQATQSVTATIVTQDNIMKATLNSFDGDSTLDTDIKPSPNRKMRGAKVSQIIIQSTDDDFADAERRYYEGSESVHYLIDRDGSITQLVPEDQRAFHMPCDTPSCISLEEGSIGIALVNKGRTEKDKRCPEGTQELTSTDWCQTHKICITHTAACWEKFSDAQITALEALVKDVVNRHDIKPADILLQAQVIESENPGPALAKGPQTQWYAALLQGAVTIPAPSTVNQNQQSGTAATQVGSVTIAKAPTGAVVELAEQEWQFFQQGTAKECNVAVRQRVKQYFDLASCPAYGSCNTDNGEYAIPWSAAFISYVMRTGGVNFPYSCSHFSYFTQIRDNPGKYACTTHQISELQNVKPGDLICTCRGDSCPVRYEDNMNNQATHCDIVTEVSDSSLTVIGGNVGNTVAKRTIAKSKIQSGGYFGFISCAGAAVPDCSLNNVPLEPSGNAEVEATRKRLESQNLIPVIERVAKEEGVDPSLLIAIISTESGGDATLLNQYGAVGLGQFKVAAAKDMGLSPLNPDCKCVKGNCHAADIPACKDDARVDPEQNIKATAKYLKWLASYNGIKGKKDNMRLTIAAYNQGIGTILNAMKKTSSSDPSWEEVEQHVNAEGRNYVQRVMERYVAQGGSASSAFSDMRCNNVDIKELGTYTFAPAFTVTVPDLLTAVERTVAFANQTYIECDGTEPTATCLAKHEEVFNQQSADLEVVACAAINESEAIMTTVSQVIADCRANKQDGCACSWTPAAGPDFNITLYGDMPWTVVNGTAVNRRPTTNQGAFFTMYGITKREAKVVLVRNSSGMFFDVTELDGSKNYATPLPARSFGVVKDGKDLVWTPDAKAEACGEYKTTYHVCVRVKEPIPVLSKGTELQTPVIKFSLFLNDSHPPEGVQQMFLSYNGLAAYAFDASKSEDVSYYRVSCKASGAPESKTVVINGRKDGKRIDTRFLLYTCNGIPFTQGQQYEITVTPVDIAGNDGETATCKTDSQQVVEAVTGISLPQCTGQS